jgi:hypothetical protein
VSYCRGGGCASGVVKVSTHCSGGGGDGVGREDLVQVETRFIKGQSVSYSLLLPARNQSLLRTFACHFIFFLCLADRASLFCFYW